jgi:hypothetical protein
VKAFCGGDIMDPSDLDGLRTLKFFNSSKALPMKNLRREGTFGGHLRFRVACIKEQIVSDIAIVVVAKVIQAIQRLSSMRQQLIWRFLSPLIN